MESLHQMLERNARLIPEKVFVHFEGVDLTYRRLYDDAKRLAALLHDHGAKKGDRIGIFLPNGIDIVVSYWAVQVLGGVAIPIAPMLSTREVRHIVEATGTSILFVNSETKSILGDSAEDRFGTILDYGDGDGSPLWERIAVAEPLGGDWTFEVADVASIFFTSGTTGVPKGAIQTHFALCSSFRDMSAFLKWRFAETVIYCALPLTNNMGCSALMGLAMYAGGKMVLDKRWETKRALQAIRNHRVNYLLGPPTIYIYMVNEFDRTRDDLSSLDVVLVGGAPVPPEVLVQFEALSGSRIVQAYGATEVCGAVTIDPISGERRASSAGMAIGSARISILDEDGNDLPIGEVGEICVGGDTVGLGYWNDVEGTAASFTERGWMSGDIGRLDAEGYLYVVDRKKDLIISGGFNIYPIEVENVLYSHPSVQMCAVVGMPDNEKGEVAVAVIVPRGEPPSAEEILELCRANVAAYKVPRRVLFLEEIPTSAVGKVLKRELRDRLAADRVVY